MRASAACLSRLNHSTTSPPERMWPFRGSMISSLIACNASRGTSPARLETLAGLHSLACITGPTTTRIPRARFTPATEKSCGMHEIGNERDLHIYPIQHTCVLRVRGKSAGTELAIQQRRARGSAGLGEGNTPNMRAARAEVYLSDPISRIQGPGSTVLFCRARYLQ